MAICATSCHTRVFLDGESRRCRASVPDDQANYSDRKFSKDGCVYVWKPRPYSMKVRRRGAYVNSQAHANPGVKLYRRDALTGGEDRLIASYHMKIPKRKQECHVNLYAGYEGILDELIRTCSLKAVLA